MSTPTPRPRDPQQLSITPAELDRQMEQILSQDCESTKHEVEILEQAHGLLRESLQAD